MGYSPVGWVLYPSLRVFNGGFITKAKLISLATGDQLNFQPVSSPLLFFEFSEMPWIFLSLFWNSFPDYIDQDFFHCKWHQPSLNGLRPKVEFVRHHNQRKDIDTLASWMNETMTVFPHFPFSWCHFCFPGLLFAAQLEIRPTNSSWPHTPQLHQWRASSLNSSLTSSRGKPRCVLRMPEPQMEAAPVPESPL